MSEKSVAWLKHVLLGLVGSAIGIGYGLACRKFFGNFASDRSDQVPVFAIMSLSFLLIVPMALGFFYVWFLRGERKWLLAVFGPWIPATIMTLFTMVLQMEGLICVVFAAPVVLCMSTVGGIVAALIRDRVATAGGKRLCVAVVALLPFAVAPVESLRERATEVRTVACSIDIQATPAQVWKQIRSVPRIAESEQSYSWHHRLGFPRPTEAVLEGTGVGSVRYARFEGNLLFVEKVTEWEENRRLSFSIKADTVNIPPTTLDEHVTIGGPYFDVLHGTYWIEPLGPDRVRLHLSSDQRLATGFNVYAGWWTEWVMHDLQDYILRIIKARAERDR